MVENDVSYRRRLDRSPEKLSPHLSAENVKAITDVRLAVENVRKKFDELGDNLDDRDKAVAKERNLKEKAEEKLKSRLIDMYKDDGHVNSELRNRLPRANKEGDFFFALYSDEDPFKNMPLDTDRTSSKNLGKIKTNGSRIKRNLNNDFDRRASDQHFNTQPQQSNGFFPLTRTQSVPHHLQSTQQPVPPSYPHQCTVNFQTTPIAQSTPFHGNTYFDSGFASSYGSSLPNINTSDPKMGTKLPSDVYHGSNYPSYTANHSGSMENHKELKKEIGDLKEEIDFIKSKMENQSSELSYYKDMCDEYGRREVTADEIVKLMEGKSDGTVTLNNVQVNQDKFDSNSDGTNLSIPELDNDSLPIKEEIYERYCRFCQAHNEKNKRQRAIIETRMEKLKHQRNYFQNKAKQLQQQLWMAKIQKSDTANSMTDLEEEFNNLRLTHSMVTYEFFPEDKNQPSPGKQNNKKN